MKLYSYCIPIDDGAAPNPYWETCTLVICKPAIRRTASIGDWIVGTGSKESPLGNIELKVVYAMRVTTKMTMLEYDQWTQKNCPNKLPEWNHSDHRRRLGDALYDFSKGIPMQRPGVHGAGNYENDLSGENALLSDHFYYFGDNPVELPEYLRPIIKSRRGHKSELNNPHVAAFVNWIEGLGYEPNALHGKPQIDLFAHERGTGYSCEV
jgi:Nucleotide modification associated domain 2